MAVGALSGAAGGAAGQAVNGLFGTATTFWGAVGQGAAIGGAGGAAGGFVGGAGNAWAGGANFKDGLKQGLIGAGTGALMGGVIGGITGGLQYQRQNTAFKKFALEQREIARAKSLEQMRDFNREFSERIVRDIPLLAPEMPPLDFSIPTFEAGTALQEITVWGNGNVSGYSIEKAVNYLNANAYPVYNKETCGRCARAVRLAIEAGGVNTTNRPSTGYAKDFGPYLTEWGFREVDLSNYSPIKGDVRVMQNYRGGNIAGHMDMYNGSRWVSDYLQNGFWPGPGYREYQPSYRIFRW